MFNGDYKDPTLAVDGLEVANVDLPASSDKISTAKTF